MSSRLDGGRVGLAILTVLGLMLSLFAVLANSQAQASHVPPDDEVPQSSAANQASYWEAYLSDERGIDDASCRKIDEAGDEAFVMPAAGEDPWVLLVVKQATTNYVYYDPIGGHSYPSTGNQSPGYSHTIVCSAPEPPEPGFIIVEKEVTEGSDQTRLFVFNPSYGEEFSLSHGMSHNSGPLEAGIYSVSEQVRARWDLQSATCDSTDEGDESTPENIDLGEGEIITCTFVNHEGRGQIIVRKVVEGENSEQLFEFIPSYGEPFFLRGGESHDSGELKAGVYSVSETVPGGWILVSASCESNQEGDTSTPGEIRLYDKERITCTFVNRRAPVEVDPGKIIVKKEVTEGSSTSTAFTFTPVGFTLDNDTLADGEMGMSGDVEPGGDYSVSEVLIEGWTLESATCDDENSTPDDINVEEGETVTCTFLNDFEEEVLNTTITIAPTTTEGIAATSITASPSTTVAVEVTEGTLPFTGLENSTTGLLAMLLVGLGLVALAGARRFGEDDA